MKIPDFLAHLRRDSRGLPVPYVNLWGEFDPERAVIRHDPYVGADALFFDDDDETVPDFTAVNPQRQRRCMIAGLCGICERVLPWDGRYLIVSAVSVGHVGVGARSVRTVHEPWFCERCARFASGVCPALVGRRHKADLTIVHVHPLDYSLMLRTGNIIGRPGSFPMFVDVLLVEDIKRAARSHEPPLVSA